MAVMSGAEAQLVGRCRDAVRQCRGDLQDLQAVCRAATSHKAACTQLLEAGTAAVDALDQLVTAAGSDLERCREAQKMAARVQSALDQVGAQMGAGGRRWVPAPMAASSPLVLAATASCVVGLLLSEVAATVHSQPSSCTRPQHRAAKQLCVRVFTCSPVQHRRRRWPRRTAASSCSTALPRRCCR